MRTRFKRIRLIGLTMFVLFALLFGSTFSVQAKDYEVYLGGMPAGFTMRLEGAQIVGLCEILTEEGSCCPAKQVGLSVGDIILSYGAIKICSALDIDHAVAICENHESKIIINRNGEKIIKKIAAVKDSANHQYKLGVLIRDSISGIGTVTYIEKSSGRFGALGHAVYDESGSLMNLNEGTLFPCSIVNVVRGERGKAGELKGLFLNSQKIGTTEQNKESGIYGTFCNNYPIQSLQTIGIGAEVKQGRALIRTTIDGVIPKEYSVSIIKVDDTNRQNKNFVVKVTDPQLLSISGGIVQGMSGSPIIQNGKLVGAVTHVFLNDPTRGFGISIQNMLDK